MRVAFRPFYRTNPYQRRLADELAKLGVEVVPMSARPLSLLRSGAAWRASVLHVHWPDHLLLARGWIKTLAKSTLFMMQLLFCRLLGKRIVWTAHNLVDHEQTFPRTQHFFLKMLTRFAHRIIVHTQSAASRVAAVFGVATEKIRVVPHANYVADYPNTVSCESARRSLEIAAPKFVYLFLGSIRGYKGLSDLIDAFRQLDSAGVRLVIAGQPFDDATDAQIRDRIRGDARIDYRPGFVPDDKLQDYFNAADVVVLPFADLLTSGSLLLVMSFAKPCIVPDVPALTDVVSSAGSIVYDPHASGALVVALREAIERRGELPEMGRSNLAAVQSWGWPEMARATLDVYRE